MYSGNISKVIIINFCQRFQLYVHALALLLLARGLTLVQISLIESIMIFTIFLMEVPTGILADRVGRKWSIFASTLLLMSGEVIFIFARSFEWYIFIALLTGTGFAFASGAVEALVYDSLPPKNREDAMKRAMGRVNSWGQIAFVIAPIVGGLIIGDAGVDKFHPRHCPDRGRAVDWRLRLSDAARAGRRLGGFQAEQHDAAAGWPGAAAPSSAAAAAGHAGHLHHAHHFIAGDDPGPALSDSE